MAHSVKGLYFKQSRLFNNLTKISVGSDEEFSDLEEFGFGSDIDENEDDDDDDDTVVGTSRNGSVSGTNPSINENDMKLVSMPKVVNVTKQQPKLKRDHKSQGSDLTITNNDNINKKLLLLGTESKGKPSKRVQNQGEIVSFYVKKKDPKKSSSTKAIKYGMEPLEPSTTLTSTMSKRKLNYKGEQKKTAQGEEVVFLETSDPDFFHSLSVNDRFGRTYEMEDLEDKIVLVKLKKETSTTSTYSPRVPPRSQLPPKMQSPDYFYSLSALDKFGKTFEMSNLKGKVVLIVNTASKCKLATQFTELQHLYEKYKDQGFVVLAFPTSQFGTRQELDSDKEILQFCKVNYGVNFPIMKKIKVNGEGEHEIYNYLKNVKRKIFGLKKITWNFEKFLIDRNGMVVKRTPSMIKPRYMTSTIEKLLLQ